MALIHIDYGGTSAAASAVVLVSDDYTTSTGGHVCRVGPAVDLSLAALDASPAAHFESVEPLPKPLPLTKGAKVIPPAYMQAGPIRGPPVMDQLGEVSKGGRPSRLRVTRPVFCLVFP